MTDAVLVLVMKNLLLFVCKIDTVEFGYFLVELLLDHSHLQTANWRLRGARGVTPRDSVENLEIEFVA